MINLHLIITRCTMDTLCQGHIKISGLLPYQGQMTICRWQGHMIFPVNIPSPVPGLPVTVLLERPTKTHAIEFHTKLKVTYTWKFPPMECQLTVLISLQRGTKVVTFDTEVEWVATQVKGQSAKR